MRICRSAASRSGGTSTVSTDQSASLRRRAASCRASTTAGSVSMPSGFRHRATSSCAARPGRSVAPAPTTGRADRARPWRPAPAGRSAMPRPIGPDTVIWPPMVRSGRAAAIGGHVPVMAAGHERRRHRRDSGWNQRCRCRAPGVRCLPPPPTPRRRTIPLASGGIGARITSPCSRLPGEPAQRERRRVGAPDDHGAGAAQIVDHGIVDTRKQVFLCRRRWRWRSRPGPH